MTKPAPEPIRPSEVRDLALAVVAADRFPTLATIDGDQPRLRPVSPVRSDGFTIYVANLRSYHKTVEIASNPRVELCYLDSQHDQVRITGVAMIINDQQALETIWGENPLLRQYLGSIDNPELIVYRIEPTRVRFMREWGARVSRCSDRLNVSRARRWEYFVRELFRTLPLMCVVLLIPILPFLFFGANFEYWIHGIADNPPGALSTAGLVIALLSTDILLPIPSSVVSTLSGWQLGWWRGTLATWIGMNLGAIIGFALSRRWGRPFALWFSKAEDIQRMRQISDRFGPFVLVITRAMPVFAEASVLMTGFHQLAWSRFLVPVIFSNLGIAFAYSAFGDFAEEHQWFPLVLAVAVAVPVLVAAVAQRWLPSIEASTTDE